ncbi:MAG: metal ABC transporter solute-binding protein, Zn/Mn family [Stellaceae bacterium]
MRILLLASVLLGLGFGVARAELIAIVAAENFYGDVAQQIGGSAVSVVSILTNPDQDPHLFEASPSTARRIAAARLVVYNGADYDPWMVKLLAGSPSKMRVVIEVASLLHRRPGDNPHLWYDPAAMPALARELASRLGAIDPSRRSDYERNRDAFLISLAPLGDKIAAMRKTYRGVSVTATEPVFSYMADAIGLAMRNGRFQLAVMNDAEPGAGDIAAFEDDLKLRRVRVLLYNNQASGKLTERMQALAKSNGIPVVGVGETEPPGIRYQDWMMKQLATLDAALAAKTQ